MLFIYADILWVLRFMFQGNRGYPQGCDAAFSLPVCSGKYVLKFFFIELTAITKTGNKRIQEQQKIVIDLISSACG